MTRSLMILSRLFRKWKRSVHPTVSAVTCYVGDTIIGIKGRVGFEAAAPMLIIGAHRFLEKYTLSKWQQYWKDQVANWYGMFLHESQYLEPVMRDIEPCWNPRNAT